MKRPLETLFVSADFSCFELRPLAVIANDPAMLGLFHRGGDAHTLIASLLLGKSAEAVTREERKRIKPVSFGTVFGMSPEGLVGYARDQYGVVLSAGEAIEYQESFFAHFTGIADWKKKVLAEKAPFSHTRLGHFGSGQIMTGMEHVLLSQSRAPQQTLLSCRRRALSATQGFRCRNCTSRSRSNRRGVCRGQRGKGSARCSKSNARTFSALTAAHSTTI